MVLTKDIIKKKWEQKLEIMREKAEYKYRVVFENKKKLFDKRLDYEAIKVEKKKNAYIRKKEEEYKRKMLNDIRALEGRPRKVYKSAGPNIKPLEFAMKLAQENARLRDTNADGYGYCISCNKWCSWSELAGGHRFTRKYTNMCLVTENINAQCHTCNFTTGPRGDVVAKQKVNDMYDKNLVKKYGEGVLEKLSQLVYEFFHSNGNKYSVHNIKKEYDLCKIMPRLIKENEKLWKEKNFYKPARKRRKVWEEYDKRH